jgi:DNA-binding GntR family transcriptional regulator
VEKVATRVDEKKCRARLEASLEQARKFRKKSANLVNVEDYMMENARFWGSLAEIAANPILSDIRLRLQNMLFRLAIAGLTVSGDREKWLTRHEDIIKALLDKKVKTAVSHAKKSGDDVWASILDLPDRAFGI